MAIRTQTIGDRVRRREDPRLITGQAHYTPDIPLPGALHLAVVRSPYPHAEIGEIETEEAAAAPGVVGIFTAADILPTLKKPFPVARAPDSGAFTELHLPQAVGARRPARSSRSAIRWSRWSPKRPNRRPTRRRWSSWTTGTSPEPEIRGRRAPTERSQLYPEAEGNRAFVWELHPEGAPGGRAG